MLNSRDISLLRPDVAANCHRLIELAAAEGWPVLVTGTVRDTEYQMQCYRNGTSRSKVPTFHSVSAGLAFDICKNVKGEEYSDPVFWEAVGRIGKKLGFAWGGDWKMVDKPHFQWDGPNHEYTSSDILRGNYPPQMPLYGGEEDMDVSKLTDEQLRELWSRMVTALAPLPDKDWGAEWEEAKTWAESTGLIRGDENGDKMYLAPTTRQQMILFLHRMKEIF